MKKSEGSAVLCMFASLLLSIFVSVLAIMLSVKLGFASNNSLMNALDEVGYYDMVYDDFMTKCESIIIPDGLSKEVFDGVFSVEQMRSDGNAYLDAQLNSTVFNSKFDVYEQKFSANIKDYAQKHQLKVDGDMDAIIADISDDIMDYYLEMIRIPYASTIGSIFRMISGYFIYVFVAMIIFTVITIWVIYKQNPYKKNRIFRYLAYGTMSGAISTLIPPLYCIITRFYTKLQIYPEYMYKFIVRYIENGISIMMVVGVILLITALTCIALSSYLKYKYVHTKHHHHHHHHSDEEAAEA